MTRRVGSSTRLGSARQGLSDPTTDCGKKGEKKTLEKCTTNVSDQMQKERTKPH